MIGSDRPTPSVAELGFNLLLEQPKQKINKVPYRSGDGSVYFFNDYRTPVVLVEGTAMYVAGIVQQENATEKPLRADFSLRVPSSENPPQNDLLLFNATVLFNSDGTTKQSIVTRADEEDPAKQAKIDNDTLLHIESGASAITIMEQFAKAIRADSDEHEVFTTEFRPDLRNSGEGM